MFLPRIRHGAIPPGALSVGRIPTIVLEVLLCALNLGDESIMPQHWHFDGHHVRRRNPFKRDAAKEEPLPKVPEARSVPPTPPEVPVPPAQSTQAPPPQQPTPRSPESILVCPSCGSTSVTSYYRQSQTALWFLAIVVLALFTCGLGLLLLPFAFCDQGGVRYHCHTCGREWGPPFFPWLAWMIVGAVIVLALSCWLR